LYRRLFVGHWGKGVMLVSLDIEIWEIVDVGTKRGGGKWGG
jgi:hypothetical protein